jgi:excisionase family DNA binding protein
MWKVRNNMQITKEDAVLARQGREILYAQRLKGLARKKTRLVFGTKHLAKGKKVTVATHSVDMTTRQAADFLRVSHLFLVNLLEKGEIPCRKVGTRRRILFEDAAAYKRRVDKKRLKVLKDLAAQAQELGMGY